MISRNRIYLIALSLLFIAPGLVSCDPKDHTVKGEPSISYKPPIIPLEISINSDGKVSFSASSPNIPTPLGTFAIHANVSFPDKKTLTIITGKVKHIYDLLDQSFTVSIPNDRYSKSTIEYDGNGNIYVSVPEPVWQNANKTNPHDNRSVDDQGIPPIPPQEDPTPVDPTTKEANGITFELVSCLEEGGNLVITLIAVSNKIDRNLDVRFETSLTDEDGEKYRADYKYVGNSGGWRSNVDADLVAGIPLKVKLIFKGIAQPGKKIRLLDIQTNQGTVRFPEFPEFIVGYKKVKSQLLSIIDDNMAPALLKEAGDFTFKLRDCLVKGGDLVITLIVVSNKIDRNLDVRFETSLTDEDGEKYRADYKYIGNSGGWRSNVDADLVAGNPTEVKLIFKGISQAGLKIRLLDIKCNDFNVRFTNLRSSS